MAALSFNSHSSSGVQFIGAGRTVIAGMPEIVPTSAPAPARFLLDQQQLASMKWLSIVQIICGVLSITLEIPLIYDQSGKDKAYPGIWCGIFFIITGIMGAVGAVQRKRKLLLSTISMFILSSLWLFFIVGFMGALIAGCNSDRLSGYRSSCTATAYACGSLLIVTSTVELIASVWSVVLIFKGACASPTPPVKHQDHPESIYYGVQSSAGSQVTVLSATSVTDALPPVHMPAGHPNLNQTYYPQQQFAVDSKRYATGAPVRSLDSKQMIDYDEKN